MNVNLPSATPPVPRRHGIRSLRPFARFMQADPLGYEDGPNMYAYVKGDPVNFTDPSGLCKEDGTPGYPGENCDPIEVVGEKLPALGVGALLRSGRGGGREAGGGGTLTRIANTLDDFAENHLKPPEPRKKDETYEECKSRVSNSRSKAATGTAGIIGGSRLVNYPRATPGGGGTSIISTAIRNLLSGVPRMGSTKIFGTNSVGGALGRGLSRLSVVGGAALLGWSVGEEAGAAKICQK